MYLFIYRKLYFNSNKFKIIKNSINDLINEFNELNIYADQLSLNILGGQTKQIFVGEMQNNSNWNYKHLALFSRQNHTQIYHCSRTIVSNAQLDGFKYLCKYFNIHIDDETRNFANEMLSNFITYNESRNVLINKRENLYKDISSKLPLLIKIFKESLYNQLGLIEIDLKSIIYPKYTFLYTSSGGNSSLSYTLSLDPENLTRFIEWCDEKINYKKSIKYQRLIMTQSLREMIKEKYNYTCNQCRVSVFDEPTLLLEIDHVIPISRGGLSIENNLQCLCWKCNRKKASKLNIDINN